MSNKNCWIVSSAIGTKTSPENTIQRWFETLHTVDSINARDPNAEIHILDTGSAPLPSWSLEFWPSNCTIHDWQTDPIVLGIAKNADTLSKFLTKKFLPQNPNRTQEWMEQFLFSGYIKSVTESHATLRFLTGIDFSKYDKVFKISGRYFLTPNFKMENFDNKYTFKIQAEREGIITNLSSVMYCFDANHGAEFIEKYSNARKKLISTWHDKYSVTDLESSLAEEFNTDETTLIEPIGVAGLVNVHDEKAKIISQ